MSRIYFHTLDQTVEVLGSERAHLDGLGESAALGVFMPRVPDREWLEWMRERTRGGFDWLDARDDVDGRRSSAHQLAMWLRAFGSAAQTHEVRIGGEWLPASAVFWNTALALGSPALSFAVHLHAWVEGNAWVKASHAPWLARTVEAGLDAGLLHDDVGWQDVVTLARRPWTEEHVGPIVTSDSSGEGSWTHAATNRAWRVQAKKLSPDFELGPDHLEHRRLVTDRSLLDLAAEWRAHNLQVGSSGA